MCVLFRKAAVACGGKKAAVDLVSALWFFGNSVNTHYKYMRGGSVVARYNYKLVEDDYISFKYVHEINF